MIHRWSLNDVVLCILICEFDAGSCVYWWTIPNSEAILYTCCKVHLIYQRRFFAATVMFILPVFICSLFTYPSGSAQTYKLTIEQEVSVYWKRIFFRRLFKRVPKLKRGQDTRARASFYHQHCPVDECRTSHVSVSAVS